MNELSSVAVDAPPPPMISGQDVVASLLYSIAHDLRSSLLTLSLSLGLIDEAVEERMRADPSGSGTVALDALHHGARELERMVQSLAILARGYRRELNVGRTPLRLLLGGHVVISEASGLDARLVLVDPIVVREVIDACCGADAAEVHVVLTEAHAVLTLPRPPALPSGPGEVRGAPLTALIEELQRHAGSAVEALAAAQVVLERQGAAIEVRADGVRLWLPRADTSMVGFA